MHRELLLMQIKQCSPDWLQLSLTPHLDQVCSNARCSCETHLIKMRPKGQLTPTTATLVEMYRSTMHGELAFVQLKPHIPGQLQLPFTSQLKLRGIKASSGCETHLCRRDAKALGGRGGVGSASITLLALHEKQFPAHAAPSPPLTQRVQATTSLPCVTCGTDDKCDKL